MPPHLNRPRRLLLIALLLAAASADPRAAQQPSSVVVTPLAEPSVLDFNAADETLLVSGASGFESVTLEGTRTRFGSQTNWPAGAPLVTSKTDSEQFASYEIFTARRPGQIVKLSPQGAVESDPWTSLRGERGLVTALQVDRAGAFGGDLLAGTAAGNIWRIDEGGTPAFVAATGLPIVALVAVPTAPRYGVWAGMVLAATGRPACRLFVVTPTGVGTELDPRMCLTDLDLVMPDTDLYIAGTRSGAAAGGGFLIEHRADDVSAFACDIVGADPEGALVVFGPGSPAAAPTRLPLQGFSPRSLTFASEANGCQPETCGDSLDNNGDGEIDEGCRELCGDGIDNNSDGETDENCPEICGDGEDNDKNRVVDDGCVEVCGDGVDNDSDDLTDAPCAEVCRDGIDNDLNGQVDDKCPSLPVQAGCSADRWLGNPGAWVGLDPDQLSGTLFSLNDALAPLGLVAMRATLAPSRADVPTAAASALVRAAIPALLNATSPRVGYPLAASHIHSQVNAALESGRRERIDALASVLEAFNQLKCPLPAQAPALPPAQRNP